MNSSVLILRFLKLLNIVLITLPFGIIWYQHNYSCLDERGILVIGLFAFVYMLFARVYDATLITLSRISEMIYSQVLAIFFADCFMVLEFLILKERFPKFSICFGAFAIQTLLSVLWCYCSHKLIFKINPPLKAACVYDERRGFKDLISKYGLKKRFAIQFTMQVEDCLKDLSRLDGIQTLFMMGVHSHDRNIILKYCVEKNIHVYMIPRIGDVIMSGAEQMHLFHLPVLRVGRYNPKPEYVVLKRVFDIISSLIVLILISPIMLITAIAIKSDGGPVFYKQKRLTQDGEEFYVLKFRSMRVDAEKDGVARLSTGEKDDRITPVGHFIRKCRIDELPQLLNIIGGSMSVVGPRPERPEIAAQYEQDMPEFRLRLQAKAGLTGYAQVYGKYNTTPYDKLQMDLMYIAKPSFLEDLRIIFATIKILFVPESTEGVEEGQITAGK